ncbi:hypothetical protein WD019_14540 [Fictibacillus sp. Mic-4]|uniref:hypothetical protein n=1 Tax=Fictibacillus sp. Mic-4 TaxID=3132826 RepID=UPI003CE76A99
MTQMYMPSSRVDQKKGSLYDSIDPELAGMIPTDEELEKVLHSELLVDCHNNYWYAKEEENKQFTIYVFEQKNGVLKSWRSKGQPNFYEFPDCVAVACEGDGSKGSVLIFSKEEPELLKEWKVNGYLWDVEKHGETIYISCYIVGEDQAVLYQIQNGKKKRINLGRSFTPTDILCIDDKVYISASPILNGDPKKIVVLNEKGTVIQEYPLEISPRSLYHIGDEILIYELDLAKGKSERIVYLNIKTGEQKQHYIPHSQIVKCTSRSLSLLQQDSQTLFIWDHANRKIVKKEKISDQQKIL